MHLKYKISKYLLLVYNIIELERKKAIRKAKENSNEGDIVLIAGKGHENYQEVNDNLYELNDKNIVNSL